MLAVEPYLVQAERWPREGRHLLAQFDAETIMVYQAYKPSIARYAVAHRRFGGEFSYSRMSWIKTSFLWMMYRSGWGTKKDQEMTLVLRLRRAFFDSLLAVAVPSSWDRKTCPVQADWVRAVATSDVRLQWGPDHHPSGAKLQRRAIQVGLRGAALEAFGARELLEVVDLSAFVAEQRDQLRHGLASLVTPREDVYNPGGPSRE